MKIKSAFVALLVASAWGTGARAAVVINEIFYNAPNDLEKVQWVELHNAGDAVADVGGWTLDGGKVYTFAPETKIDAKGYLVVALDVEQFKKAYPQVEAIGPFKRPLKRGGERIELRDAAGAAADAVRYKDEAPWPASADGYSASLERISPDAPGGAAENWAGSPLPDKPAPAGTPGKANANASALLPPEVSVAQPPSVTAPGKAIRVEAEVKGDAQVREVTLLYRVLAAGAKGDQEPKETAVAMSGNGGGRLSAEIPAQPADTLLRYRVKVVGEGGETRFYPAEHDLRPTLTTYVHGPWESAKIPFALLVLGGPDREAAAAQGEQQPWGRRGFGRGPRGRFGPPGFGPPPGGPRPDGPPPGGPTPGGPPAEGPRRGFGPPGRFPGLGGDAESPPKPPRGSSAFIYFDPATGKASLFDHINAVSRGRRPGFKLFFHKDRPFNGMTAVSVFFEGSELSLLAEALSYDVYRRAGNAAPLTEFVRLWVDGKMVGYNLLVERPNRAFLRRNKVADGGNLYKARWFGQGLIGQHPKKTHTDSDHEDLIAIVDLLRKTHDDPDKQWEVIQNHFDVQNMATFFACNMVLSHWDGFFNNYYTYHDFKTDKWQMYPWDHDQTWGIAMGPWGGNVLVDIPLNFGMDGARPPGGGRGGFAGDGPFGGGPGWWRPPGYFSGPLLANPHFRTVFLARVKKILDDVYTEGTYGPLIDATAVRLKQDSILRAKADGDDAEAAESRLKDNVEFLKTHLQKRREFLLQQDELRGVK